MIERILDFLSTDQGRISAIIFFISFIIPAIAILSLISSSLKSFFTGVNPKVEMQLKLLEDTDRELSQRITGLKSTMLEQIQKLEVAVQETSKRLDGELSRQVGELSRQVSEVNKKLSDEVKKLEDVDKSISHSNREIRDLLLSIFTYPCPKCTYPIQISTPRIMVKDIHEDDGRPIRKLKTRKESKVICEQCKGTWHIVYP
ncbi:MAG: gp58-like family protein [Euryarchaeota archaeon]|nr:gp58-like family protein [Euryarchaeota archaeon]